MQTALQTNVDCFQPYFLHTPKTPLCEWHEKHRYQLILHSQISNSTPCTFGGFVGIS